MTNGKSRRTRMAAKQASMADVADRAGVSMITVSRMLREPSRVAPETRRRIEQAMAEVGYVPNLVAGGLAATRTRIVAAIVPYIQHGVFADAVQGLTDGLRQAGYCVLLGSSGGVAKEEETIIRTLLGHRPAGLVIQGANHTDATRALLVKANIPIVEMGTLTDTPVDMCVGYSNREAACGAVGHMIATGCRRIGLVVAPIASNDRHSQRLMGYVDALERVGITHDSSLVATARGFNFNDGCTAVASLLDRHPDLDGLFCASDIWAMSALAECRKRGIQVPAELSVCGFNDQEFSSELSPPLTTVRVPRLEIGAHAAELIIARLSNQPIAARKTDVGFELVLRESTLPAS
ncbi:LacI family DNA-binding transcriptional regulator [Halotalea alkalilenta]|nr:LacI family DNA-binding transcriptional regulator [Halotalea alkalilenta]